MRVPQLALDKARCEKHSGSILAGSEIDQQEGQESYPRLWSGVPEQRESLSDGQANLDGRSAACAIGCRDLAVVEFDCPFGDGEAHTKSAGLRATGHVQPVERAKD